MKRWGISLFLAFVFVVTAAVGLALAQTDYYISNFLYWERGYSSNSVTNPENMLYMEDGVWGRMNSYGNRESEYICAVFDLGGTATLTSGAIQAYAKRTDSEYYSGVRVKFYSATEYFSTCTDPGWVERGNAYSAYSDARWLSSGTFSGDVKYIAIKMYSGSGANLFHHLRRLEVDAIRTRNVTSFVSDTPDAGGAAECDTLANPDFEDHTAWTGFSSFITGSVAILPEGSYVAQNIELEPGIEYRAVISVTRVISSSSGDPRGATLMLGDQESFVHIPITGSYQTQFTALAALAGPILYKINAEVGSIDVDFTCLYPITSTFSRVCIAPANGEFDSADDWDWHRGAYWNAPTKSALLPFNEGADGDKSLIVSQASYTMPNLITGTYLLLSLTAETTNDQAAVLGGIVGANEHYLEIYAGSYDYEMDISSQAGQTVTVAFSNSGPVSGDFPAEDDVLLDNVCIFVSDHPPSVPVPSGAGTIVPFSFGFNYTCPDVPSILLGYGIDVIAAQAAYDAGVSSWTVDVYIPWLAGALWNNVGSPVSCILVEFMRLMVGLVEQQINIFTNYVNWMLRSANSGSAWLQDGFEYLAAATSFSQIRTTAYGWLNWFARGARNSTQNVGVIAALLNYLPDRIEENLNTAANAVIGGIWNDNLVEYLQLDLNGSQLPISSNPLPIGGGFFESFLGGYDMVAALASMAWLAIDWFFSNVLSIFYLPFDIYSAFQAGSTGDGFASLISCDDTNFWCNVLAGMQLVNQASSNQITYPVVIVGIAIATLWIVWRNIQQLVSIKVD